MHFKVRNKSFRGEKKNWEKFQNLMALTAFWGCEWAGIKSEVGEVSELLAALCCVDEVAERLGLPNRAQAFFHLH